MVGYKYSKLPETAAIDLIRKGRIVVNTLTGTVYSAGRGALKEITPCPCKNGYLHIRIYHKKARRSYAVHRLVVMAATGQMIPEDCEVDHQDHDRQNNSIENLMVINAITHRRESALYRWHGPQESEANDDYPACWDEEF